MSKTILSIVIALLSVQAAAGSAQALITHAQAASLVLDLYPEAKIVDNKYEHKKKQGTHTYKVKILTADEVQIEVRINAVGGGFLPPGRQRQTDLAKFTPAQARSRALSFHQGGSIIKTELKYEKNTLIYKITIITAEYRKSEVKIDAMNGDIVQIKRK